MSTLSLHHCTGVNWPPGDPATTSHVAVYSQKAMYVLSSFTESKIFHQPNESPG